MATQRIYALFQDVSDAERGIGALLDHGIPRDNIGVVARRPAEEDEASHVRSSFTRVSENVTDEMGEPIAVYEQQSGTLPPATIAETVTPTSTADTVENVNTVAKEGITTTTPQDAAAGAAVGTGVGLVAGMLAAAAAITLPGVGLILAGGTFAAAFAAAMATTAAGALAGGAAGYLRDMGMPEQAAASYADRLHEGNYLVTATVDTSQYDAVKLILLKYNAAGVDSNLNPEDLRQGEVWGSDPALVEQLQRGPVETISRPVQTISEPIVTTPFRNSEIVTERADGTPIIPAQDIATPGHILAADPLDEEEAMEIENSRTTQREIRDAVS